jgi:hypothetical protein
MSKKRQRKSRSQRIRLIQPVRDPRFAPILELFADVKFTIEGPYGVEAFVVVAARGLAATTELGGPWAGGNAEVFPHTLALAFNPAGYGAVPGSVLTAYRQWHPASKPTAAQIAGYAGALLASLNDPSFDIDPGTPMPPGHEWRGGQWIKPTGKPSTLHFEAQCFALKKSQSDCLFNSVVTKPGTVTDQFANVRFYVQVQSLHA